MPLKLLIDYLDRALAFERMAAQEIDLEVKAQFQKTGLRLSRFSRGSSCKMRASGSQSTRRHRGLGTSCSVCERAISTPRSGSGKCRESTWITGLSLPLFPVLELHIWRQAMASNARLFFARGRNDLRHLGRWSAAVSCWRKLPWSRLRLVAQRPIVCLPYGSSFLHRPMTAIPAEVPVRTVTAPEPAPQPMAPPQLEQAAERETDRPRSAPNAAKRKPKSERAAKSTLNVKRGVKPLVSRRTSKNRASWLLARINLAVEAAFLETDHC
jgi:hypothetical protein